MTEGTRVFEPLNNTVYPGLMSFVTLDCVKSYGRGRGIRNRSVVMGHVSLGSKRLVTKLIAGWTVLPALY
jgi:hypothetical protein